MATLPLTRSTRALAVGLALAGAVLVGPAPVAAATGPATPFGIAADEPGTPLPPPDPAPAVKAPVDQGPANFTGPTIPHRRHFDGDPAMRR
jgi:hypothetical protein